jgi:hypothetical protein
MQVEKCLRKIKLGFIIDLGVRRPTGELFLRVDSGHQRLKSGQYMFKDGEYTFSTRDVGTKIVFERM